MDIVIVDPLEQSKIGAVRTLADLPPGLGDELARALRILRNKGVMRLEFVNGDLAGTIAVRTSSNVPLSRALPRRCVAARGEVERALRLLLWFDMPKSEPIGRTGVHRCRTCGAPFEKGETRCRNMECASHAFWKRIDPASEIPQTPPPAALGDLVMALRREHPLLAADDVLQ